MSDEGKVSDGGDPESPLQEKILTEHQRLGPDDTFTFACHPGVSCFNHCCADVNIFLSPYDVLRMKKRLGLTSGEFLDQYTLMPVQKDMKTPVVVLRMQDDEAKTCTMLGDEGCSIYSDRPWPCRMYPVGMASPKEGSEEEGFYFLLQEEGCNGFESGKERTIREWLTDQGVKDYDDLGEEFKEIALHPRIQEGKPLEPKQIEMFFMACYDLDKFRRFLFETTFFEKFDVEQTFIEDLKRDDIALLKFGFSWLRFSFFGEKTLKIKDEVVQAKQSELS
jgi:uncharacterized protein